MRRIVNFEGDRNGIVVYELDDGDKRIRVNLDARACQEYGPAALLRRSGYGHLLPTERVVVMQDGRRIGTVPPTFDPLAIKSTNWLYDVRGGDFVRDGDAWVAARTLGPGDLEAVPGFVWERT